MTPTWNFRRDPFVQVPERMHPGLSTVVCVPSGLLLRSVVDCCQIPLLCRNMGNMRIIMGNGRSGNMPQAKCGLTRKTGFDETLGEPSGLNRFFETFYQRKLKTCWVLN